MSITTLQPSGELGKDTWIGDGSNHGTEASLKVGGEFTTYSDEYSSWSELTVYKTCIQFDLTGVTGPVTTATLQMYSYAAPSALAVELRALQAAWDQNALTDVPVGGVSAPYATKSNILYGWNTFDITNLINKYLDHSLTNYGFIIQGVSPTSEEMASFGSSNSTATDRPKLVLEVASPVASVSPTLVSKSNVAVVFNTIPAPLTAPIIIITSTSTVTGEFVAIPRAYINASITSTSQVAAALQALAIMNVIAPFVSTSVVRCTLKLVIPEFLIIRGKVSIAGVPVPDAFVRAIADDGSKVYSSTSDTFGNYEVAVDSSGLYHLICYKRDVDGSIFSSVSHPYINVENPEVKP